MSNRVIVFGSHKGLGYECVKALLNNNNVDSVLGLSRKDSGDFAIHDKYHYLSFDFTKAYSDEALYENLLSVILSFNPNHFIYCAGGGPYGTYESKEWKDHEWALKLNFLFPARLIWSLLRDLKSKAKTVSQPINFIYIGSAIAESDQGDILGPSYAAAKWAMKGLVKSLSGSAGPINFKIVSPGYMDTDLLPKGSAPRSLSTAIPMSLIMPLEAQLLDPKAVARDIISQLEI